MNSTVVNLEVVFGFAPLLANLPLGNVTSVYNTWPPEERRAKLPEYLSVVVAIDSSFGNFTANEEGVGKNHWPVSSGGYDALLISPPIHVVSGNTLKVHVTNRLPSSEGLSLHWHGFEMGLAPEYDGVVGVTQCPIALDQEFTYDFLVQEAPGTYWYHSHSGDLGLGASYNGVKGALIVHPAGDASEVLVNELNHIHNGSSDSPSTNNITSPFAYQNEKILFFSDGNALAESTILDRKRGSLNALPSEDENGWTVGTHQYEFGTINGELRHIVYAVAGQQYKLRLINAASMYAFRISIDSMTMDVVAADSVQVEPYLVDEVILHAGERFDVLVNVPNDLPIGSSLWIRADTLESRHQGYSNGIRALLHIVESEDDIASIDINTITDPLEPIEKAGSVEDKLTMNCYSKNEIVNAGPNGGCLPIMELQRRQNDIEHYDFDSSDDNADVHLIDFDSRPPPQYSHFVRFDGGPSFTQHLHPHSGSMFSPSFDMQSLHPHTNVLHLPANKDVILIWRTSSLADNSIHLHGLKAAMLSVVRADRLKDCTLVKCKFNDAFQSKDAKSALQKYPHDKSVQKDTFILPAGSAVATRIKTGGPGLWFVHSQISTDHLDGMAFIINVGKFSPSADAVATEKDFPDCDSALSKSKVSDKSCECYVDRNAVLDLALTKDHLCSREHLCYHNLSQAANLEAYVYRGDLRVRSDYATSDFAIFLLVLLSLSCMLLLWYKRILLIKAKATMLRKSQASIGDSEMGQSRTGAELRRLGSEQRKTKMMECGINLGIDSERLANIDSNSPLLMQIRTVFAIEWGIHGSSCISVLRCTEVILLAILTGFLFWGAGRKGNLGALSETASLFFFTVVLWTFPRLYASVADSVMWAKRVQIITQNGWYKISACYFGRMLVYVVGEAWWPIVFCFICYPPAALMGDLTIITKVSLLVSLHLLCYISLGILIGVSSANIAWGMIAATVTSQSSILCAGFYTTLPDALAVARYFSPFFYTFRSILKSVYQWSDTYSCVRGTSSVGPNECFLETSALFNAYKKRGIDVAVFNSQNASENDVLDFLPLLCILFILHCLIYFSLWFKSRQMKYDETKKEEIRSNVVVAPYGNILSESRHSAF